LERITNAKQCTRVQVGFASVWMRWLNTSNHLKVFENNLMTSCCLARGRGIWPKAIKFLNSRFNKSWPSLRRIQ
jgi:hypothetical protein